MEDEEILSHEEAREITKKVVEEALANVSLSPSEEKAIRLAITEFIADKLGEKARLYTIWDVNWYSIKCKECSPKEIKKLRKKAKEIELDFYEIFARADEIISDWKEKRREARRKGYEWEWNELHERFGNIEFEKFAEFLVELEEWVEKNAEYYIPSTWDDYEVTIATSLGALDWDEDKVELTILEYRNKEDTDTIDKICEEVEKFIEELGIEGKVYYSWWGHIALKLDWSYIDIEKTVDKRGVYEELAEFCKQEAIDNMERFKKFAYWSRKTVEEIVADHTSVEVSTEVPLEKIRKKAEKLFDRIMNRRKR